MKKISSIFVKANVGIDTYEPPSSVSKDLRFTRLVNMEARRGGLVVSRGLDKITDINDTLFNSFGAYTNETNNSYLYAFSDEGIYQWDATLSNFNATPLTPTFTANLNEPWAVVDYIDGLYFTRHGVNLRRVVDGVIGSEITGNAGIDLSARYAVNAHDHLVLANFDETSGGYKMRWSQIFDFTNFVPTNTNEADEFSFNYSHGEITGLTVQKDIVNIYTEKSIFQAFYVGYPIKYELKPLQTDVGNKYHHAVIQTKDIDFFIGEDNFYQLEGSIVAPIGNKVWNFFKNTVADAGYGAEVRGVVDVDRDRVGWLYTRVYDATYPNGLRASKKYYLWYYYREQRWASEEADFISLFKPKKRLFFYDGWDAQTQSFDNESRAFDGLWQATSFLYVGGLFGGEDDSIYALGTGYDGAVLHFETAEIHLETPKQLKNLSKVTIHAEASATVATTDYFAGVTVSIGYRRSDALGLTWTPLTAYSKYKENEMAFSVPSSVPVAQAYAIRFTHSNTSLLQITYISGITLDFVVTNDANDID